MRFSLSFVELLEGHLSTQGIKDLLQVGYALNFEELTVLLSECPTTAWPTDVAKLLKMV